VSRQWRDTAASPRFWSKINVSQNDVQPDALCAILRRHHHVVSLDARDVELTTQQLAETLPLLTNLETLQLQRRAYNHQDITLVSENLPQLTYLVLAGGTWNPIAPTAQPLGGGGVVGGGGAGGMAAPAPLMNLGNGDDGLDEELQELQQQMLQHGGGAGGGAHLAAHLQAIHPMQPPHQVVLNFPGNSQPRLSHPNLRSLALQSSTASYLAISCPNLTTLDLHLFVGTKICVRGCTALQQLRMYGGTRPTEPFARSLLGIAGGPDGRISSFISAMNNQLGFPLQQLRALVLESNQSVTDHMLEVAATRFPHLTRLQLRGCSSVAGVGLGGGEPQAGGGAGGVLPWDNLQELHIASCDTLTGANLATAINKMFALRTFYLEGSSAVSLLRINSRSLREIHLRNSSHLSTLELNTVNLDTFDLYFDSRTRAPSASALRHLTISSANLKKLSLAGCPLLNDLQLGCAYLQELELIECDAISSTGSHFPALHSASALPELEKVAFHSCRMLSSVNITSMRVNEVKISSCRQLSDLKLKCDVLHKLELVECSSLANIDVSSKVMKLISLGCCHSLEQAILAPLPKLETLILRGCNKLHTIVLECPALRAVDASLCGSFTDEAIAALARCPNLQELQIGACDAVTADGITQLGVLKDLQALDLSYMPLQDPSPLFESIRGVTKLSLLNSYAMEPDALCAMIHNLFTSSDILRTLDISCCNIGPRAAAELAVNCNLPLTLAMNGIRGAPGDGANQHQLWPNLHSGDGHTNNNTGQVSKIKSLSMGNSHGLDAFYLGLVPKNLAAQHNLAAANADGGASQIANEVWTCADVPFVHVDTPLKDLEELNLGLGFDFVKVAVSLPRLHSLHLNNCAKLSQVTLDCPNLTRLSLLACRNMSAEGILTAIRGCKKLVSLDISLSGRDEALCAQIRQQHGAFSATRTPLDISITPLKPPKRVSDAGM
jgi:hypothetical protein